jgi:hypothetical protein
MRSILIQVLENEVRKIRIWKWVAITSIALHLFRSF